MALSSRLMFESPDLCVRHVACCADHAGQGDVETAGRDTLVLPLNGAFAKHLSPRDSFIAKPSMALFFARGRPHRISHPHGMQDDCLAIDFRGEVLDQLLADAAALDRLDDKRLRPFAVLPAKALAARGLLAWRLREGIADGLDVAATAIELLACVLDAARRGDPVKKRRYATFHRHHEMVEGVQAALLESQDAAPSLAELAARVHTTPFHLARTFREHVGLPVNEYLQRLRLSRAVQQLLETDADITDLALRNGFSSHSHFTYVFRRHTGITPVEFRRLAASGPASKVRKIMTALASLPA